VFSDEVSKFGEFECGLVKTLRHVRLALAYPETIRRSVVLWLAESPTFRSEGLLEDVGDAASSPVPFLRGLRA